jgi:penicillin-binding protein 2
VQERLVTCGDPGSVPDVCWNGSPYQPVPVAEDVSKDVALRVLEQPEDYPGVVAEQQSVRSYPRPFGVNMAHVLGYLSPITEDEYDLAVDRDDRSLHGASDVGRAGVEKQYDEWLRGLPGYRRVAVDSMGRVLGDDSEVASTPGDTLVTSIDAGVQGVVERELARSIRTQRGTVDEVTGRRYAADAGAAVVLEARTGRVVAMASQPTYDPGVWVGGISTKELEHLYSERPARHCSRGDAGAVRSRLDVEAVMTAGRPAERLPPRHEAAVLVGVPGRQPGLQELRVRRLRQHRLRPGARRLLQHVLLPDRLRLLAALRHRRRRRGRP